MQKNNNKKAPVKHQPDSKIWEKCQQHTWKSTRQIYVFYNRKKTVQNLLALCRCTEFVNHFFSDLQWTNHFESEFTKLFVGKVRHVTQLMSNDGSGKTDFSNTIQGLKQANPGEKQNLFLWKCNLSCLGGHYFVREVLNSNTEEA